MALITPILQYQNSFDKSNGAVFYFNAVGGNKIVKNRLTIKKNSDNTTVYQETQETILFKHVLDSDNALINGNVYNAYINTYDSDGEISDDSNIVQFTCYTTPTLTVDNIPSDDTIKTSNFNFNVLYEQEEYELLDYLIFKLYNEEGDLLVSSEKIYNYNTPPFYVSYLIGGMEDLTTYKLQIEGRTVNQTDFSSEFYEFLVSYDDPILNSVVALENDCTNGRIKIFTESTLETGSEVSDISYIKIKRKLESGNVWSDVYVKKITTESDLSFEIYDYFAPKNNQEKFEYAVVPVLADGFEIKYVSATVQSSFNAVFISDTETSYRLITSVGIDRTRVFDRGVLQPIGRRVPFTVTNSETDYESGTVSARLIGDFEQTRVVDRNNVSTQTAEFMKFLTNGKTKVLKDWNGNICLCDIVGGVSYSNSLINGTTTITFQYNEQGEYDNNDDLEEFSMIRGD